MPTLNRNIITKILSSLIIPLSIINIYNLSIFESVYFTINHDEFGTTPEVSLSPSHQKQKKYPNNKLTKNLHSDFPLKCGSYPTNIPTEVINIIDIINNDPPNTPKHDIEYSLPNHYGDSNDNEELFKIQVCVYDVIQQLNELLLELGITRWATHGGSAISTKCYNALNPWDDDADITILDCSALQTLWKNSPSNITEYYPDLDPRSHSQPVYWSSRLIKPGLLFIQGDRAISWYKLMSVGQAYMWKEGQTLGGIDIECMNRRVSKGEIYSKQQSGWLDYMKSNGTLEVVPFGPTTIQTIPTTILDKYIHIRYGKQSPCQFPFENGVEPESSIINNITNNNVIDAKSHFNFIKEYSQMNFALKYWYLPKIKRMQLYNERGDTKQNEKIMNYMPNINKVEVDNTISSNGCINWNTNNDDNNSMKEIKVIGWNAERGIYWDKFYNLIKEYKELNNPLIILLNEMDVGMSRSGNIHTIRKLALSLNMNYAYGIEFIELTSGTKEEQEKFATQTKRDVLSLHGNAILTTCIIKDAYIVRDRLPTIYYSKIRTKGANAYGYEVRLGGRMGLFARIFQNEPRNNIPLEYNDTIDNNDINNYLPLHFVVGNVHKLSLSTNTHDKLLKYYTLDNNNTNNNNTASTNNNNQLGIILQGDIDSRFCKYVGLQKIESDNKTWPVKCLKGHGYSNNVDWGNVIGDHFCIDNGIMLLNNDYSLQVTPPCEWSSNSSDDNDVLTLSDHAIQSIVLKIGDR